MSEQIWLVKSGLHFERRIEVLTSPNGPAFDLTNYSVDAQVRLLPESVAPVVAFNATIVAPATGGAIELTLTTPQTTLIPVGRYVFSVVLTPPSGKKFELLDGTLEVRASVTR